MGLRPQRIQNSQWRIQHVGRLSRERGRTLPAPHHRQREVLHILQLPVMTAKPLTDLSRLCVHTITTKPWKIEEAAANFAAAGVGGITVWRDALAGRNIRKTGDLLRSHGLKIVSLCRGGFFPSIEKAKRVEAIEENKKAIDEAAELGTDMVVLVCGAEPRQDLNDSRKQIKEAIQTLLPHAESAGV